MKHVSSSEWIFNSGIQYESIFLEFLHESKKSVGRDHNFLKLGGYVPMTKPWIAGAVASCGPFGMSHDMRTAQDTGITWRKFY
jgi:hypothetical protein